MADMITKIFVSKANAQAIVNELVARDAATLAAAQAYADSKVAGVDLSGIARNEAEINLLKAAIAEGGSVTLAIEAAQKAGDDAMVAVEALEAGQVKLNKEAIEALQGKDVELEKAITDNKKASDDAEAALELRVKSNEDKLAVVQGDAETEGSIKKAVADVKTELEGEIGDLESLETTNKDDLVVAINEVRNAVNAGGTAAAITMTTDTTTEGMLKSYTIKQGENTIGVIDIPKELMAVSGEVVVDPEGLAAGTYIKLTIQNGEPVYINVASLIDNYTAAAGATQVQLTVDAATRQISAVLVAGGVGTTELADLAVTTAKIADGNVTKAKLSTAVQSSLDKADSAVQAVTTGSANGTISVDGSDVAVYGLGDAAYADVDDFDAAGSAATAKSEAVAHADSLNSAMDGRVSPIETDLATAKQDIDNVEAKAEENATAISDHTTRLEELESVEMIEMTDEEVAGLFPAE